MSFTDDDLKRLKECSPLLQGGDVWIQLPKQIYGLGGFDKFNLTALLARLEAAEVLLDRLTNPKEPYKLSDVDKDHELYLAWRKAAGKDEK